MSRNVQLIQYFSIEVINSREGESNIANNSDYKITFANNSAVACSIPEMHIPMYLRRVVNHEMHSTYI